LDAGRAWLAALPDQPYGLIHGDFELDNLVRDGEEFHVLDFDDLSYGPLAADIAIAVADIYAEPERLDQFLEGYAEVIPPPDGVRDHLAGFLGLNQAIKIARLMRAYESTSGDDQPEWVLAMRARHSAWLAERKAVLA
jgi:Ser/Thr protein kinase RdoA (MazF antagonist)